VLYDLMVGSSSARPGAEAGYAACVAADTGPCATGPVGAGTGATVAKWHGREHARPGGIGTASLRDGELVVGALIAVNAFGDRLGAAVPAEVDASGAFTNTTIGVVATNAALDKVGCLLAAQAGHDGLARALDPVHATVDGDALVTAAVGPVAATVDQVRILAARAVEQAVLSVLG
jgi:L-aminopeptidase/D-esterase-like protein